MPHSPDLPTIALRILVIGASLAAWFVTQRRIGSRAFADSAVHDRLHTLTARGNAWLHAHPRAANGLVIASSLCVDLLALFVLAYAVLGPTFRPFWGLFALFVLRQLAQTSVALPTPPGMIWRYPGFPSLFVTYGVGNDLFFSGHTALAVYGAVQLASLHVPALTAAGVVIVAFQMTAMILLRAHWTMDILAGLFAALAVSFVLHLA
jgi:hypothetical protein